MKSKIRLIATMGVFFSLALILSFLEGLLPPLPMLPPGVKLGLSNIVTMYCLLYLGTGPAYLLAILKAGFAVLTRGTVAGLLSLCGGLAAVTVMTLLAIPKKHMASVFLLSVLGAVSHNLGQLAASSALVGGTAAFAYFPVLLLSGVLMGTITGIVLKTVLPAANRINFTMWEEKRQNPVLKADEIGLFLDGRHNQR